MLGIVKADARKIPLADESVQCVVTSPPYWGLRKYAGEQELVWGGREGCKHEWIEQVRRGEIWRKEDLDCSFSKTQPTRATSNAWEKVEHRHGLCQTCGAWRGAYGLEPTVEMYVQHTVEILREIRRVLRHDGVCFLNIGDSYWGQALKGGSGRGGKELAWHGDSVYDRRYKGNQKPGGNLKPKDLCLIPFRVALAAQADGWWVRSDIIWAKPNPMPESVTDRPTRSHEYILMLTKSAKYYWDAEAVAEPSQTSDIRRPYTSEGAWEMDGRPPEQRHGGEARGGENSFRGQGHFRNGQGPANRDGRDMKEIGAGVSRNLRSVWTFTTEPYPEAHFATFPEELPKRCILAATSAKGACAKCGTPWERVVERTGHVNKREPAHAPNNCPTKTDSTGWGPLTKGTNQWGPGCACGGYRVRSVHSRRLSRHSWYREHWQRRIEFKWPKTIPCLALDPFAGSGTVGKVAIELGRRAILCDLAYQDLASKRTAAIQRPLIAPAASGWRE